MDPIGSTYGSTASIASGGTPPARRQDGAAPGVPSGAGADQSALPPKLAQRYAEAQLGIQSAGDSEDEFRPYGPRGLQPQGTPADPTTPDRKESLPTLPGEVKQADPQMQQEIAQLKATEEKVKAHEAAHKSGGAATGPISYSYTRGPDGKSYITGGEVPITISSGNTPQETINRMQQVIQAALAPADPSPQDRAVAASAAAMQQAARQEQSDKATESGSTPAASADTDTPANGETPQVGVPAKKSSQAYSDPAVTGSSSNAPRSQQHSGQGSHPIGNSPGNVTTKPFGSIPSMTSGSGPSPRLSLYH